MDATAAEVQARHGLPQGSWSGYADMVGKAKSYFTSLGVKFADGTGGLRPNGVEGDYVLFFSGGETGGHVMYGRVRGGKVQIFDDQSGAVYGSHEEAQKAWGGKAELALRVESVEPSGGKKGE